MCERRRAHARKKNFCTNTYAFLVNSLLPVLSFASIFPVAKLLESLSCTFEFFLLTIIMIRSRQRWETTYPARKGATWGLYHLEIDKSGTWILLAAGMAGVVLADTANGRLVQDANPHEAAVIYVTWSPTAKKFASGKFGKTKVETDTLSFP